MVAKTNMSMISKMKQDIDSREEESGPLRIIDTPDGRDVVMQFSSPKLKSWYGYHTSDMVYDHEGRQVLSWLIEKDFNPEAIDIIKEQLHDPRSVW